MRRMDTLIHTNMFCIEYCCAFFFIRQKWVSNKRWLEILVIVDGIICMPLQGQSKFVLSFLRTFFFLQKEGSVFIQIARSANEGQDLNKGSY